MPRDVVMLGVSLLAAVAGLSAQQPPASPSQPQQPQQAQQAQQAPPATSRIPDPVRTRETIGNDAETEARVDNEPLDPSFKGFLLLPGTSTRIKFGGVARLDVIHDFEPIGNHDEFVVSSIPVDVTAGFNNTEIDARDTRFNVELRRTTVTNAELRGLLELDFFGSSGQTTPNLRHAYGQVLNVLAGFTTSTLQDVDARPDILDHEGPAARITVRQALLRYTFRMPGRQSFAVALEQPRSDIPSSVNGETVTPIQPWPDVIARYRLAAHRGHLQIGGIVRSIAGFVGTGAEERQVTGAGATTSLSMAFSTRDTLVLEASGGYGIARYVKDMSGHGLDLALDDRGVAHAPAVGAVVVGVEHLWSGRLRSTAAFSFDRVENFSTQPTDTYRQATYAGGNLLYTPVPSFTAGVEYSVGRFEVKNGRHNSAQRVQLGIQYDFVR